MALSLADPAPRGYLFTLIGEAGLGKTSLAASFPKPVFIQTEAGLIDPNVPRFAMANSMNDVIRSLQELGTEQHEFRTVVIDSVTQLNVIVERDILAADPKAVSYNSSHGGYGASYSMAASQHQTLREWCGLLSTKGMHVVFIAHVEAETMRPPDDDSYERTSIRMHRRSLSSYVDNVDMVGHVKLQTAFRTSGDDRKIAISSGDRELHCHAQASSVCKNRFGITKPLPFAMSENPLTEVTG